IIFLTAHTSPDFPVAEAYRLGAVDYLVKPLVPEILRAKVTGFVELFQKTERLRELERRGEERGPAGGGERGQEGGEGARGGRRPGTAGRPRPWPRRTGARTSSSPCSATSCATPSPPFATPSRCCGCAATTRPPWSGSRESSNVRSAT